MSNCSLVCSAVATAERKAYGCRQVESPWVTHAYKRHQFALKPMRVLPHQNLVSHWDAYTALLDWVQSPFSA